MVLHTLVFQTCSDFAPSHIRGVKMVLDNNQIIGQVW